MKTHTHTHTPGDWTYELKSYENGESFFQILGTPNGLEENIPHRGAFIAKVTGNKERRQANAQLIAAAPDLLQVAKDFFLLAQLHDWEGAAIDFAKATLAKAEGRE